MGEGSWVGVEEQLPEPMTPVLVLLDSNIVFEERQQRIKDGEPVVFVGVGCYDDSRQIQA